MTCHPVQIGNARSYVPRLLLVQRHGIGRNIWCRHLLAVLAEALQEQLLQHLLLLRHGKEDARVRGQLLAQVLHAVRELVDGLDALGQEDGACGNWAGVAREAPGGVRGRANGGEVHQGVDLAPGLVREDLQLVEVGAGREGPDSEDIFVISLITDQSGESSTGGQWTLYYFGKSNKL